MTEQVADLENYYMFIYRFRASQTGLENVECYSYTRNMAQVITQIQLNMMKLRDDRIITNF